ncbi:Transglutaminase-like superfamily protein [Lachnospiraceae bacterium]|nr:Transglutaminase-like superfamily protein [Lachnospiraceae bacterium]
MFNKKLLCKFLPAFIAVTAISGSRMTQGAFAAPTSDNTIVAEEIREESAPVGGWEPVEVIYKEDTDIKPTLRFHKNVVNGSLDNVFSKGAGNVGYNSLASDEMRTFYNKINDIAEEFMSASVSVTPDQYGYYIVGNAMYFTLGLSKDEALQVYHAYDYDHPAYYWISNTVCTTDTSLYLLTEKEYASPSARQAINKQIADGVRAYAALANKGEDTLDKISIIHDMIIDDVDYAYKSDGTTPESEKWAHSVHGVFDSEHKRVVCEGYADTFALMMNYLDIPNYYIVGKASSSGAGGGGGHAWNAVYDDAIDKYMYMDLTWDDCGKDGFYNKYFGMPKTDFEKSHFKYSSSNTGSKWLYDLTGDFADSFEETYYNRGGFYYDSADYSSFAKKINTKVHRFGTMLSFLASDTQKLGMVINTLSGADSFSYYRTTYKGTEYYIFIKNMTDDVDLSSATITLNKDAFAHTGNEIKPTVKSVVLNDVRLIGDNYNVSYENNISAGNNTAKVIVTGNKRFTGTANTTFSIRNSEPTETPDDPSADPSTDPTETPVDPSVDPSTDPTETPVDPSTDPTETPVDPYTPSDPGATESSDGSDSNSFDHTSNYSTVVISDGAKVTYPLTVSFSGINRKKDIQKMLTIRVNGEEKTIKKISIKKAKNVGTAVITKIILSDGTKLKKLSIPIEIVKYTVRTEDIKSPVTEKKIKVSIPGGKTIKVSKKDVTLDETNKTITFNTKNLTGTCSY